MLVPLFVSIPHSGERVPDFCSWLQNLPEPLLMRDVDRYVDRLYEPVLTSLNIPLVKTEWHRYAADLNRIPEDVDQSTVSGAALPEGAHARGFHWAITTQNEKLMAQPMDIKTHQQLIDLIYKPFHHNMSLQYDRIRAQGAQTVYHLDLHSMPSRGTNQHRDPGEFRADIVVSDCQGKSSKSPFVDLVIVAYVRAGFKVAYNWPYYGGRVSEQYGRPETGQQSVQVELNRALYMDEASKKFLPDRAQVCMGKLEKAIRQIHASIGALNGT